MVQVCDPQCISVASSKQQRVFPQDLGTFLWCYEPHCFAVGAWVTYLLLMGYFPFTRPSPWSFHQLHAQSVLRRNVCLSTTIMVSNWSYAPPHSAGAKRGSATYGADVAVESSGVGVDGDSGKGMWKRVMCQDGGMASPSIAKLGLSRFPTCWVALQQGCGYSRRTAQVAWGWGLNVKVVWGTVRSKSDSETPGWGWKVNVWSNPTKKTNSSILARLSPMQFLRPADESSVFTWWKDQTRMFAMDVLASEMLWWKQEWNLERHQSILE